MVKAKFIMLGPASTVHRTMQALVTKSISNGTQQVTLQNKILTSKCKLLSLLYFPTSPIKLKLGLQIGRGLLMIKPPGPIIMITQSETVTSSHNTFITLFSGRCFWVCLWPLHSLNKLHKIPGPKPFC